MSAVPSEDDKFERRAYPRFKARCPVHYLSKEGGIWNKATLEDYSASGVCFYSEETLLQNTKLTIQITREAHPTVPAMSASAIVVRCDVDEDAGFRIACKLTLIRDDKDKKQHYLRR